MWGILCRLSWAEPGNVRMEFDVFVVVNGWP